MKSVKSEIFYTFIFVKYSKYFICFIQFYCKIKTRKNLRKNTLERADKIRLSFPFEFVLKKKKLLLISKSTKIFQSVFIIFLGKIRRNLN